jgi:hypothetical protein
MVLQPVQYLPRVFKAWRIDEGIERLPIEREDERLRLRVVPGCGSMATVSFSVNVDTILDLPRLTAPTTTNTGVDIILPHKVASPAARRRCAPRSGAIVPDRCGVAG